MRLSAPNPFIWLCRRVAPAGRRGGRQLPERGRLPAAGGNEHRPAGLPLPAVPAPHPLVRQPAGAELDPAAGTVPRLPRPDLDPLSAGRGRHGRDVPGPGRRSISSASGTICPCAMPARSTGMADAAPTVRSRSLPSSVAVYAVGRGTDGLDGKRPPWRLFLPALWRRPAGPGGLALVASRWRQLARSLGTGRLAGWSTAWPAWPPGLCWVDWRRRSSATAAAKNDLRMAAGHGCGSCWAGRPPPRWSIAAVVAHRLVRLAAQPASPLERIPATAWLAADALAWILAWSRLVPGP